MPTSRTRISNAKTANALIRAQQTMLNAEKAIANFKRKSKSKSRKSGRYQISNNNSNNNPGVFTRLKTRISKWIQSKRKTTKQNLVVPFTAANNVDPKAVDELMEMIADEMRLEEMERKRQEEEIQKLQQRLSKLREPSKRNK